MLFDCVCVELFELGASIDSAALADPQASAEDIARAERKRIDTEWQHRLKQWREGVALSGQRWTRNARAVPRGATPSDGFDVISDCVMLLEEFRPQDYGAGPFGSARELEAWRESRRVLSLPFDPVVSQFKQAAGVRPPKRFICAPLKVYSISAVHGLWMGGAGRFVLACNS